MADPRRVMVWRPGFEDWKAVEEVREVAQQLFRPPPLRAAPPSLRRPFADANDSARQRLGA
jgi:hypothetical protein